MFTGLTNLIFGKKTIENNTLENTIENDQPLSAFVKTKEDEDGWIFVSKQPKNREAKEEASNGRALDISQTLTLDISNCDINEFEEEEDEETDEILPPNGLLNGTPTPSTPSSLTQLDPEGSWYLTPPPCFTAGNTNSTVVSPIENLLIEHPSMSVYQHVSMQNDDYDDEDEEFVMPADVAPKRQQAAVTVVSTTASTHDSDVAAMEGVTVTSAATAVVNKRRQKHHHASRSMATRSSGAVAAELYERGASLATSRQKKLENRKTKFLQRSQMERNNKVREQASANKHKRRKDYMKNPSGANNNRKC